MDHSRVAATVLDAVGGPENISAAAHCATRLRLVLVDNDKIDQKTLDNDPDIKGTFAAGGMFQIIIGPAMSISFTRTSLTKVSGKSPKMKQRA